MKKTKLIALLLILAMVVSSVLVACPTPDDGTYTYNIYTSVSPSNWNALTYQDNNDTQIMNYIGSSFFEYDFKYDAQGNIIDGQFEIEYSAATKLEDLTASYVGKYDHITAGKSGLVWKITLRNDLKWDDGTPIKASDFVYTMKQQLDPLFKNYRADSFYVGALILHNAKDYVFQGEETHGEVSLGEAIARGGYADEAAYFAENGAGKGYINWKYSFGATRKYDFETKTWVAAADAVVDSTVSIQELFNFYIGDIAQAGSGMDYDTLYGYVFDEIYVDYTFPVVDFKDVGIFVGDTEYEIVLVLDNPLYLLKDDGTLSYKAAYNMSDLPLVKESVFEDNKKAPAAGSTLWTSNYNSSVSTSASWGPYKLVNFQSGKQYILEKNENWFGYGIEQYEGLYQTDRIVCETIKEYETAWQKFLAGNLDSIGIDVSKATDYKGSQQAYYTPDDFVGSMQLQSNKDSLISRQSAGKNKTILSYLDFRKAMSLAMDRADYARVNTTSSLAGFGLFNSMHYYDVANGGVYRNTDEAKKVLCEIYAVNVNDYANLDAAYAAITGYDLTEARKLVTSAYNAALAAGDISATDIIFLTMGTSTITESGQRMFDYCLNTWQEMVKTTPLEGRFDMEFKEYSTAWANDFRAGAYDICTGGWTGAAWDPGYFLLAYLSPSYMYSRAWKTNEVMMTFTMKGVGENGGDITDTMSLLAWYNCLNGASSAKYNWATGSIAESLRLQLIAALEKEVLSVYYTVPLYYRFTASLRGFKINFATYEYNTFMAYGGVRYLTYNYNDTEWANYIGSKTLDYKS